MSYHYDHKSFNQHLAELAEGLMTHIAAQAYVDGDRSTQHATEIAERKKSQFWTMAKKLKSEYQPDMDANQFRLLALAELQRCWYQRMDALQGPRTKSKNA